MQLKVWTFMRYLVLAGIVFSRVLHIMRSAKFAEKLPWSKEGERVWMYAPFKSHPKFTKWLLSWEAGERCGGSAVGFVFAMILAGGIFVQSEGVGLVIYFAISGVMDNFAVFIYHGVGFCDCVVAISLYSMALVTFLPNVFIAYLLQANMYDDGTWFNDKNSGSKWAPGRKTKFVLIMMLMTVIFFVFRLYLVYGPFGWANSMNSIFGDKDYQVFFAAIMPPMVDAIQSGLLIAASVFANVRPSGEANLAKPLTQPLNPC